MDSEKAERLLVNMEALLSTSNVNLGRKSKKREEFISSALELIKDFVAPEKGRVTQEPEKPKKPPIPPQNMKNIMCVRPKKKNRLANKHGASMTESDAFRADEELGYSPFNKESDTNE